MGWSMPLREMREGDRRGEVSIALLPLVIVLGFIAFVIAASIAFEAISGWLKRYRHHARVQQARRELYSLTDLDLRDMGITRGDISRIARGGPR